MVKSLNTEMAHTSKGTWFREGPIYGNIMVGDKAFEFYNDTKLQDYVQIFGMEITYVIADVYFGGKFIPRFESVLSKMDVSVCQEKKPNNFERNSKKNSSRKFKKST